MDATYKITQERLAAKGLKPDDEITIFRGSSHNVPMAVGETASWKGNVLESWTTSRHTAHTFASDSVVKVGHFSYTISTKIKVRDIFSFGATGFGDSNLGEIVPIGTRIKRVRIHTRTANWANSGWSELEFQGDPNHYK